MSITAILLMRYVYQQDSIEKEPPQLLISLAWHGVLAALVSIVLEMIAQSILNVTLDQNDPRYQYVLAFLCVAAIEEGTKFFFLYHRTWHDPNFNFRFDGIVYAVFVSLGFAAFENVKYALPRAILAIPGHMGFSVFMGVFYGRAKLKYDMGDRFGSTLNLIFAYVSAVALHGIYDSCCMSGTKQSTALFVLFVIAMYLIVFGLIRHESRSDTPV